MRNFEKCEKEVLNFIEEHGEIPAVTKKGKFIECNGDNCEDCIFKRRDSCNGGFVKWLYEEYKEPKKYPKLTKFQYELLKRYSERYEYATRDKNSEITLFAKRPNKDSVVWYTDGDICSRYQSLDEQLDDFDFIKWEDKEPWNIQELLENCEVEE